MCLRLLPVVLVVLTLSWSSHAQSQNPRAVSPEPKTNELKTSVSFRQQRLSTRRDHTKLKLGIKLSTTILAPALYLGSSIYVRHQYADDWQHNHFGTVNGILGMGVAGTLAGALIGLLTVPIVVHGMGSFNDARHSNTGAKTVVKALAYGSVIILCVAIGAAVGLVGGVVLGIAKKDAFKERAGAYYTAASFTSLIPMTITIAAIQW